MGKRDNVFLDVGVGKNLNGRVVFELYDDVADAILENFYTLCSGELVTGKRGRRCKLSYEGCHFFKIVKGEYIQCGDYDNNDGTGGGSIYGGYIKERSGNNVRIHSQAGLLTIVNMGDETYGSQFCITLGKVMDFDANRYYIIGRVIEGMELIRAIEHVPVNNCFVPSIETGVLACGILPNIESYDKMSKQRSIVNQLMDTLKEDDGNNDKAIKCIYSGRTIHKKTPHSNSATTIGKQLLQDALDGKEIFLIPNFNKHTSSTPDFTSPDLPEINPEDGEEEDEEVDEDDEGDEISKRLRMLSKKLNQCNKINKHETLNERQKDDNNQSDNIAIDRNLNVPALAVEKISKIERTKKKNKEFGWNVFNQDALYRAHKKRLRDTEFNHDMYEYQKMTMGDSFYNPGIVQFNPSEAAKDAIVRNLEKQYKKRSEFSRRRLYDDDAQDISYINERNRVFNRKLERTFGNYSLEIKQNLERGTAL